MQNKNKSFFLKKETKQDCAFFPIIENFGQAYQFCDFQNLVLCFLKDCGPKVFLVNIILYLNEIYKNI